MLLFFNDVSGSEVLVILVFILIFFGSKSIPGIARTFGRTIHQIKSASSELQDEIRKSGVDMKKDLNLTSLIQDSTTEMAQPLDQMASDLDQSVRFEPPRKQVDPEVNIVENVMPQSNSTPEKDADANQKSTAAEDPDAAPTITDGGQPK
jgi:sec-independent protein translocase protein TatA